MTTSPSFLAPLRDDLLRGAATYRRRRRRRTLAALVACVAIVGAVTVNATFDHDEEVQVVTSPSPDTSQPNDTEVHPALATPPGWMRVVDPEADFSIAFPRDWRLAFEALTPNLGGPDRLWERVTVGTGELTVGGECSMAPFDAIAGLAPNEVLVSIQEPTDGRDLGPRSASSQDDLRELAPDDDMFYCGVDADSVRGWMGGFTAGGRPFYVWVAMGPGVSEAKQAEVWQVIDSFTPLAPATQPSTAEQPHFAPSGTLHLARVPQGVSGHTVAGYAVILSRSGDEILAFLAGTPRAAAMGDSLYWCEPTDTIVELPVSASQFSRDGRKVGGPAPRALDRVDVTTVGDDDLRLDLGDVTISRPTEPPTTIAPGAGVVEPGVTTQDRRYYVSADESWPGSLTSSRQCDLLDPSDNPSAGVNDAPATWGD